MTVHYFAYGSNMLTERLQARCSTARPLGIASIAGYTLAFSKRGQDSSGKATLVATSNRFAEVYGVVFELAISQLPDLDRVEGLGNGYERPVDLSVVMHPDRSPLSVHTYIADPTHCEQSLQPFDWYLDLVVKGAQQHGLPKHHLEPLRAITPIEDPVRERRTRREALAIIARLK